GRHHRKVASRELTLTASARLSSVVVHVDARKSWRPPRARGTFWLLTKAPTGEDANGPLYWPGCARRKHDRGDREPERQAAELARGGDERPSTGGVCQDDPEATPRLPRGGDAERVAVRDPVASRRRDRCPVRRAEPGTEGRRARRFRLGGAAAHRPDRAAG